LVAPTAPQIPIPRIAIANPPPAPHAITAVAVEKPVIAPAPLVSKPAPVIAPTPPKSIAHTHTTPPYPPLAIRLGEQGTVRLRIALDSSGIVRSVDIVKSSGSTSLDRAAVDWVSAHWRYAPATHDGKPIASSVLADVRFDLRNAR
jgi:protein TonB